MTDDEAADKIPERIGDYVVERPLGKGTYGCVYQARDRPLNRYVAIKVPTPRLLESPEARRNFRTEARIAAQLRHPNIVTVHQVVGMDDESDDIANQRSVTAAVPATCVTDDPESAPFFIVYEFIDGTDLAKRIANSRMPHDLAALLVADVADALHYAHKHGLYHRDIKPQNILLDKAERPYVTDFGFAVHENERAKLRGQQGGTPAYMAPEQVRNEGHRVDGRTDIFSLGVVLYELLCGRRPFSGANRDELYDQIESADPPPLRSRDETTPRELERICLKAIEKHMKDRYSCAKDMADELRLAVEDLRLSASVVARSHNRTNELAAGFSNGEPVGRLLPNESPDPLENTPAVDSPTPVVTATTPVDSDELPIKIVPKGLRSFDAGDAEFFLHLLPGPTDRNGLPESLRFWKTRIEARHPEETFTVGVIYGPSGCGKSSLMKAGLLPRLGPVVLPIYIEATRDDTEARLARMICLSIPGLSEMEPLSTVIGKPEEEHAQCGLARRRLAELVAQLRRQPNLVSGSTRPDSSSARAARIAPSKLVIVLDQFEQWLHACGGQLATSELVQAMRQADGVTVQFVLMVREDFWVPTSRLLQEIEVSLLEDRNARMVDLFDLRHAKRVLRLFGQAYGCLPQRVKEMSAEQHAFIDQAVTGLSQEGKVISVRLSLFAEMMKLREWTPASLREVGGTAGVGVTFLEETFSSRTSRPEYRSIAAAARSVLGALLPELGAEIKGRMRSHDELQTASGLSHNPRRFDRLIEILDGELRIITPSETEKSATTGENEASEYNSDQPNQVQMKRISNSLFHLSHDYLVDPLRAWLTTTERRTFAGRAKLCLKDRTERWLNCGQHKRDLPSPFELVSILLWTTPMVDNKDQVKMVRRSGLGRRLFWLFNWGLFALLFLVPLFWIGEFCEDYINTESDWLGLRSVNAYMILFCTGALILLSVVAWRTCVLALVPVLYLPWKLCWPTFLKLPVLVFFLLALSVLPPVAGFIRSQYSRNQGLSYEPEEDSELFNAPDAVDIIARATQRIAEDPSNAAAFFRRARARAALLEDQEAIGDLRRAFQLGFRLNEGGVYSTAGRIRHLTATGLDNSDSEEAFLSEILNWQPNSAVAYATRAEVRSRRGHLDTAIQDYEQAFSVFDKAKTLRTNEEDEKEWIETTLLKMWYSECGDLYTKTEQPENAIRCYTKAIELDPGGPNGWTYRHRAEARVQLREWEGAVTDFAKARALGSKDVGFIFSKKPAEEQLLEQHPELEITYYREILRIKPRELDSLLALAEAYWKKGELAQAQNILDRLVTDQEFVKQQKHDLARLYLVCLFRRNHDKAEQMQKLMDDLATNPPSDEWHAAICGFLTGKLSEKDLLSKAPEKLDSPIEAHFFISQVAIAEEALGKAKKHLKECIPTFQFGRDRVFTAIAKWELSQFMTSDSTSVDSQEDRPEQEPAFGPARLFVPPSQPRRIVNSRKFQIGYKIQDVGPSGVGTVSLYITEDQGAHWFYYGDDDDQESPFLVEVQRDGNFGFLLGVTNKAGKKSDPPLRGDKPPIVVVVDTTPPRLELQLKQSVPGQVQLSWTASDTNLDLMQLRLEYTQPGVSKWKALSVEQKASGKIDWPLPQGGLVNVQGSIGDLAGNATQTQARILVQPATR
jgi:serine/threonine protein kinase/tetratricopeptide (TPR) repeat protein